MNSNHLKFSALFLLAVVLVSCGGGSSSSGGTTVRSAYVANSGDGTISQYTIDATGALTPIFPSAFIFSISGIPTSNPSSVTVVPSGKYAYVANSGDYFISQFTLGAGGALVPMSPPTVASGAPGSAPTSVTVDPLGKYAYVANSLSDDVAQFSISATTGALTPMSAATVTPCSPVAPPCAQGKWPVSVTIDPAGKYVYVANLTSNTISQYTISASGALTPMSPATVAAGLNPMAVAIDPSGTHAYVTNNGDGTISQYSIVGGALTTPVTVLTGINPTSIAIDKNGSYAYVTSGDGVTQYTLTNGVLSMPVSTFTGGGAPRSVTIDASGKYLYVANTGSDSVSQFTIGAGGALSAPTLTAGAVNSQPYSITTAVSLH